MKILNTSYREATSSEYANKTPVSKLNETSELFDNSYIHIVQHIKDDMYESMKMSAYDFKQKVYEAVQNTFKTKYWDTHCEQDKTTHSDGVENTAEGASFKDFIEYLNEDLPTEVESTDPDGFINHIYYDFDVVKRYIVKRSNDLQSQITGIEEKIKYLDHYFQSNMKFHTTIKDANQGVIYDNRSVTHYQNDNTDYCQMEIKNGNKISNTWTCPGTGNLVVYGWLDSSSVLNNKAIPSAYCVLEAKINGDWEIIAAQPVMPAKSITYVGFNVPVLNNLVIRARTGFTVGAKSGQYPNAQDGYDTLSNSTANGFKCMIFSNENYNVEDETSEG